MVNRTLSFGVSHHFRSSCKTTVKIVLLSVDEKCFPSVLIWLIRDSFTCYLTHFVCEYKNWLNVRLNERITSICWHACGVNIFCFIWYAKWHTVDACACTVRINSYWSVWKIHQKRNLCTRIFNFRIDNIILVHSPLMHSLQPNWCLATSPILGLHSVRTLYFYSMNKNSLRNCYQMDLARDKHNAKKLYNLLVFWNRESTPLKLLYIGLSLSRDETDSVQYVCT